MAKIKTKRTQQYIADKIGVSQATLSMWLNHKTKPRGLQLRHLQEKFPDLAKEILAFWKKN